jgi:hypothetical protein
MFFRQFLFGIISALAAIIAWLLHKWTKVYYCHCADADSPHFYVPGFLTSYVLMIAAIVLAFVSLVSFGYAIPPRKKK